MCGIFAKPGARNCASGRPGSPAHAQHARPKRHTQPVNGWGEIVVPASVIRSSSKTLLLLHLWALHHDNQLLTCYHVHTHPKVAAVLTMLAPHRQEQPAGPGVRVSLVRPQHSQPYRAPQQQSAHTTQPSDTSTCAKCTAAKIRADAAVVPTPGATNNQGGAIRPKCLHTRCLVLHRHGNCNTLCVDIQNMPTSDTRHTQCHNAPFGLR
jgi:hypothetical protein